MEGGEGAEDEGRGFECVLIYVCAENGVNAHQAGGGAGNAVVARWERVPVLIAVSGGGGGEGEVRNDGETVLDAEGPGEDGDDAGGCEEPEPEGGEEGGDEVDDAVGEPGLWCLVVLAGAVRGRCSYKDIERATKVVCPCV